MRSLSRQESLLRVAGTLVVVLAFSYLFMPEITLGVQEGNAAINRKVVVAETLLLRTAKNTKAAALTHEGSGQITLKFGNSDQGPRISLRVFGEGGDPVIHLVDDKSGTRVSLGTLPEGNVLQAVRDRGAEEKVSIFTIGDEPRIVTERPQCGLKLDISKGGPSSLARLEISQSVNNTKRENILVTNTPFVMLADSSGKPRASIFLHPQHGSTSLSFYDGQKRARLLVGVEGNGYSAVGISDGAGRTVREIP